ncbi:MAG: aldo/keto reductase [Polyangiales bacterium]
MTRGATDHGPLQRSPGRLSRRRVLGGLLGAGAAVALGPVERGLASQPAMRKRTVPSSGEPLPVVGLGTWRQFDVGEGRRDRAPLERVLRMVHESGGRVVDSSPMYGRSERVVGELANELGIAEELFMATKVWTDGQRAGAQQMRRSMKRMRSRPMDLVQVHNLRDWRAHLGTLEAWKKEGLVRYIGVTHYLESAFDELERIVRHQDIDFVQLPLSVQTRKAEERLLSLAADRGVAVVVNRPFEGGSLFARVRGEELPTWARPLCDSWAQLFLKYILGRPEVTCVIPGTSDPEHARDNMGAGRGPLPNAELRRRMASHVDSL